MKLKAHQCELTYRALGKATFTNTMKFLKRAFKAGANRNMIGIPQQHWESERAASVITVQSKSSNH